MPTLFQKTVKTQVIPEGFRLLGGFPDIGGSGALGMDRSAPQGHVDPGIPVGATTIPTQRLLVEAEAFSDPNRFRLAAQPVP